MKITILVISIFINIILSILLFLKSALNEILKEWWIDKQKSKKEQKQRLFELRRNLLELLRLSFLILLDFSVWISQKDQSAKEYFFNKVFKPATKEWGKANKVVLANEIFYPEEIKQLYKNFEGKMEEFTGEIIKEGPYKDRLLEMHNEINSLLTEIINKVDEYL